MSESILQIAYRMKILSMKNTRLLLRIEVIPNAYDCRKVFVSLELETVITCMLVGYHDFTVNMEGTEDTQASSFKIVCN